jgi:hypothetical protein
MKISFKHGLAVGLVAVFVAAIGSQPLVVTQNVRAQESRPNKQQLLERAKQNAEQRKQEALARAEQQRAAAKTRLEEAKLRACQNRERAIQNIMARISDRGQKHLDLFTKIADRVKAFHEDKGLNAENYDALVAEIDAKKAEAQAAVDVLKSSDLTFDCESEDPKGTVTAFKDMTKDMIDALQAYRTAVKDLIVAVAKAQQEAEDDNGGEQL